jgi:hypothetical protein
VLRHSDDRLLRRKAREELPERRWSAGRSGDDEGGRDAEGDGNAPGPGDAPLEGGAPERIERRTRLSIDRWRTPSTTSASRLFQRARLSGCDPAFGMTSRAPASSAARALRSSWSAEMTTTGIGRFAMIHRRTACPSMPGRPRSRVTRP